MDKSKKSLKKEFDKLRNKRSVLVEEFVRLGGDIDDKVLEITPEVQLVTEKPFSKLTAPQCKVANESLGTLNMNLRREIDRKHRERLVDAKLQKELEHVPDW